MGKLNSGIPQVPQKGLCLQDDAVAKRMELPIWNQRVEIIEAVNRNQIVLVTGDTGSGKTTQARACLHFQFRANVVLILTFLCFSRCRSSSWRTASIRGSPAGSCARSRGGWPPSPSPRGSLTNGTKRYTVLHTFAAKVHE